MHRATPGSRELETDLQRLMGSLQQAMERCLPALSAPNSDVPDSDVPGGDVSGGDFGAARLVESMRYSLFTPGKRIRPMLFLAAVEAVGSDSSPLTDFAAGLEMIHAYSLVHDDLPAMDDDDLRRGRPTNHIVYGDGLAVLAGDGLLTEAFTAMLGVRADPALLIEAVADVSAASGYRGMVGGQAADMQAERMEPDAAVLRSIHARKTGALLATSVRAGAILGRATPAARESLAGFGDSFGLAFQIADDLKDELAPSDLTGKAVGGDLDAGKMTYPALYGVEHSRELCVQELKRSLAFLEPLGEDSAILACLAEDVVQSGLGAAAGATAEAGADS